MAYIFNKHKLSHPYMVEANAIDYLIWEQIATESGGNAVMLKTPVLSSMCKMRKLWSSILRTSRPQENNQTLILQGFRPLWPNKILPHPILGRNRTNERNLPTWFLECELELHVFEVWKRPKTLAIVTIHLYASVAISLRGTNARPHAHWSLLRSSVRELPPWGGLPDRMLPTQKLSYALCSKELLLWGLWNMVPAKSGKSGELTIVLFGIS